MKSLETNKKKIKKILATFGVAGIVLLTASCGKTDINKVDYNDVDLMSSQQFIEEFSEIYNSNERLHEEWEPIYPEIIDFLEEYGDDIDQEQVLNNLRNVEFVDRERSDSTLLAETDYEHNSIWYNARLYNKSKEDIQEIKFHEAIHYFFQENFIYSNRRKAGVSLDEGNAQLITMEENVYSGVTLYKKNVTYVKTICELIGIDNYHNAVTKHSYQMLIDYLSEYCSERDAKKLIDDIDKACINYNNKGTEDDLRAWEIINEIFENKYGISIEESDNEIIRIYSNELADTNYNITGARQSNHAHVVKNYFLNTEEPTIIEFDRLGVNYGYIEVDNNGSVIGGDVLETAYYNENNEIVDMDGNHTTDNHITYNNRQK